jgi:hypothetical protein
LFVGRFFSGEVLLIFIREINRANLGTLTAAGAFGNVNETRLLADAGFEVSRFALQCKQFAFG